nr:hypothetical protein Iba_scaffold956110CG0010 [Ipomoea batatas]
MYSYALPFFSSIFFILLPGKYLSPFFSGGREEGEEMSKRRGGGVESKLGVVETYICKDGGVVGNRLVVGRWRVHRWWR